MDNKGVVVHPTTSIKRPQTEDDLTLYIDFGSQPSRAVYCFLKINKIPFKLHQVSIMNMEHRKPEYRKINPNMKVPAISDFRQGAAKEG
jgi:hypothetical protein